MKCKVCKVFPFNSKKFVEIKLLKNCQGKASKQMSEGIVFEDFGNVSIPVQISWKDIQKTGMALTRCDQIDKVWRFLKI